MRVIPSHLAAGVACLQLGLHRRWRWWVARLSSARSITCPADSRATASSASSASRFISVPLRCHLHVQCSDCRLDQVLVPLLLLLKVLLPLLLRVMNLPSPHELDVELREVLRALHLELETRLYVYCTGSLHSGSRVACILPESGRRRTICRRRRRRRRTFTIVAPHHSATSSDDSACKLNSDVGHSEKGGTTAIRHVEMHCDSQCRECNGAR